MILTGLSMAGANVDGFILSFVLPYVKCDLKLSLAEQGTLNSVPFAGLVLTSYFWGFLLDTCGRKRIISLASFGGFVFSFLSGFVTNIYLLLLLRFLSGALWVGFLRNYWHFKNNQNFYCIRLAGVPAGVFAYISEFHTSKTAGRAVAYASMYSFGFLISCPLLLMLVIPMDWTWNILGLDFKPWRLFVVCFAIVNLLNGIIFAFLPESPKFLLTMNQKGKALQVLRRVYAFNTGKSPEVTFDSFILFGKYFHG